MKTKINSKTISLFSKSSQICSNSPFRGLGGILLLFLCININAQSKQITLSAKNTPIKEVFSEIQQKSGYRILYNDEVVADELRVSVNASNQSVKDILTQMLASTKLTFVLHSDDLIIVTSEDLLNKSVEIFGRVADENNQPIEFANVILYEANNPDRIKQGCVSNAQGSYKLVNLLPGNYKIKVSFVGFETLLADISIDNRSEKTIKRDFHLKANIQNLDEVVVEGERRVLTAEAGKLVFYMPTLLKNKTATNAYEALKEIPGVIEQNDVLKLVGTSGTTVLIDSKKTNMTTSQIMNLLRTIPVSRLENVEIMYNVPPQYNIRGAAINVILKKHSEENKSGSWQGEVTGTVMQRAYTVGSGRANFIYTNKNTTFDVIYTHGNYRTKNDEIMTAEHKLNDKIYTINQENEGLNHYKSHNVRLGLSHTFKNKDNADISYLGTFDAGRSDRTAITEIDNKRIKTVTGQTGPSYLHNFKADYDFHFGLKMGAEHTVYEDNSTYHFNNTENNSDVVTDKINSGSCQQIGRTFFYANQTHNLPNNWTLNYGGNYSLARTKNYSDAVRNDTVYRSATFNNMQNEIIRNVFAGFTKAFSAQFSLQASLAVEHYKATETSDGKTTELWNNFALFPTLNASYVASANHIFQFGVSSNKVYPSYWLLNPTVYHFNAYGVTYGNPHLKPIRAYSLGLTYVYKQKYVVRTYFNHLADFSNQMPYQRPDKLEQVFMEQNFNFSQQVGVMGVLPFNIGKRISNRLTLNAMYAREKDDEFFDLSFDRKTILGIVQLNTDINLSDKPNLKLNISGYAVTPTGIQGLYDLGASGDLTVGLTWTFAKERAKLILQGGDILNTRTPFASIDYQGQKSNLKAMRDTRALALTFTYRIGDYKERQRKEVDTSRFGTK